MASFFWVITKSELEWRQVALLKVCECVFRCKMTEREADFRFGSGQYEMALKQESGEEERKEHTPALLMQS